MDVNVISDAMTDFKNYKKNLPEDRSKNIVFIRFGYYNERCLLYTQILAQMLKLSGAKIIDVDATNDSNEVGVIKKRFRKDSKYSFGGGIELFQCKAEFKVEYDE
jgi:hypothetical protein